MAPSRSQINKESSRAATKAAASMEESTLNGLVLSSTRRFIEILSMDGNIYLGTLSSRKLEAVPGDHASFRIRETNDGEYQAEVSEIRNRSNLLKRSFDGKIKLLAANLSGICVLTAPPPLFNTIALDRVIAAAENEEIPVYLIANKCDLPNFSLLEPALEYYEQIGIRVFRTSALISLSDSVNDQVSASSIGREALRQALIEVAGGCFAFAGISGVGKSSLLKVLFPEFSSETNEIRTGNVSLKTGQGKQTTSSARGYPIEKPYSGNFPSTIIDLPGIQSYGISHINMLGLHKGMRDILKLSHDCKFSNCLHSSEPGCAVLAALKSGTLPQTRFDSFRDMALEIKREATY